MKNWEILMWEDKTREDIKVEIDIQELKFMD